MSQAKWSPEPWHSSGRSIPLDGVDECPVYDANGKSVVDVAWYENGEENADRIVACVNFCRGISNETLEACIKAKPEKPSSVLVPF